MDSITQDMKYRQSIMKWAQRFGVSSTARKFNKASSFIYFWLNRYDGSKVERSRREDQKRFYNTHTFHSKEDFAKQLTSHQRRTNDIPMRPLGWQTPNEKLKEFAATNTTYYLQYV